MNNDPWAAFLKWEGASRDTIDFKTIYVDMADDLVAGLLLSQIIYWYLPSKKGQSKLRVFKDGYYWIAKARHEWWDEIRVKARQIDRATEILEEKGIIITHLYRFNNAPTTHIRINKEGFLTAWDNVLARFDETVKSEILSDPFSPNLQFDLTDSASGFDETVISDLPESVQSLTEITIDFPETTAENTSDFSQKTKTADPLSFDLERQALENSEANYAVPVQAGGSFTLGDLLTTAASARLGRSEPKGKKHDSALAFFEKALKAEGLLQGDIATLTWAVRDWLDPEGEYAFFLPQYDLNPKHELALRHFGIVLSKAKKQAESIPDHRAADVEATELSLAALEVRRAARPPPPQDDEMGAMIKTVLGAQMGRNEFRQYVRPTRFACDNGVLRVAAPDAFTRDWLENRLAVTIGRALAGVAGGPGEVAFEVGE